MKQPTWRRSIAAVLVLSGGAGLAVLPATAGASTAPGGATAPRTTAASAAPAATSTTAPPTFTSPPDVTIASGATRTITVTASGTPTPSIHQTGGTLPPGMTFDAAASGGSATISGTPKPAAASYTVDLTASSSAGSATQQLVVTFSDYGSAPTITSASSFVVAPKQYDHVQVVATGTPTPTLHLDGTLPPGMSFHPQSDGTATISGYLQPSGQTTYDVTVTATNGNNPPAVQHLALDVAQPVTFTSPATAQLKAGSYDVVHLTTNGTPTPKLTLAGNLPPGMSFRPNDQYGSATIQGQVPAGVTGTYQLTVTATNGVGAPVIDDLTLSFSQAPAITSPSQLSVTGGQPVRFTVHATGVPTPAVTEQGALPAGLHFYGGNGIAVIAGTPRYGLQGTTTIQLVAANGAGANATQQLHLVQSAGTPPTVPGATGYWYVTSAGQLLWKGQARPIAPHTPQSPRQVVGIAPTPDQQGYYLVSSFGGVFTYGDATFRGSITHLHLRTPTVALATTPDGRGYWEVTRAGNVFTFGDARFYGSTAGRRLPPIVAFGVTPDGHGYWLVSARGNVYNFGDAHFAGSAVRMHIPNVVGFAPTPDGHGYWLATANGGVIPFGDATSYGSLAGRRIPPVTAFAATGNGHGYWLVTANGSIFPFGDAHFFGSSGAAHLSAPVVGFAPQL